MDPFFSRLKEPWFGKTIHPYISVGFLDGQIYPAFIMV
jgi:hypothetical protein